MVFSLVKIGNVDCRQIDVFEVFLRQLVVGSYHSKVWMVYMHVDIILRVAELITSVSVSISDRHFYPRIANTYSNAASHSLLYFNDTRCLWEHEVIEIRVAYQTLILKCYDILLEITHERLTHFH